ncbi:MAG: dihydrofolate reductase [Steroidobacteraceae bacterium]
MPGRSNIVLSRKADFVPSGAIVVPDFPQALAAAGPVEEIFVIGGAQVYARALAHADRLYLTVVHADVDGDVRFPPVDAAEWREVERSEHAADARHAWPMTFSLLERTAEAAASG